MKNKNKVLSTSRINRIKVQGYSGYSDMEISLFAFGNRFAYLLCTTLLIIGVVSANVHILLLMSLVAFGGIVLPYHPFDYIYNHALRHKINKPKLPQRSKQLKFACIIATLWLITTAYLFNTGSKTMGYVAGGLLTFVAFLVSTVDLCIPSLLYNYIFKNKV